MQKTKFEQRAITHVKNGQNVTKLKLDLCYLKTNSYTKFQVNISKDDRENAENRVDGHRVDGLTDRRTDRRTDGQSDRRRENL